MSKIATVTFLLPAYWACYFINGDETGYTTAELREITHWESICAPGPCLDAEVENVEFTWRGDDGSLGADRCMFTFQVITETVSDGEVIGYE